MVIYCMPTIEFTQREIESLYAGAIIAWHNRQTNIGWTLFSIAEKYTKGENIPVNAKYNRNRCLEEMAHLIER